MNSGPRNDASIRPVPQIPQMLGMTWRIVGRRCWPYCAAFRTDDANSLDLVTAHFHERRLFVSLEGTGTKING
jgi:hypothetical protein